MIRILPEILSNQIAAGEVVQRPASVVKELVENSIDANAGHITIEMEKGGKSLIRVADDGTGLSRDQALLAIERYATSKIFDQTDLFSIGTFGFRGEALPSIASVSRFCLVTKSKDADTATRVEMAGGKLLQVSETGAPDGTMVAVKHLFFNTPARRKFLKADTTEAGHITDTISGMALGNPKVGFSMHANGKPVRHFPADQDLLHRAMLVLGTDVADQLYPMGHTLDHGAGPIHISGVCAHPSVTRSTAGRIYLFVNNRLVYDKGIVAAVFRGFAGRIMKGRFPVAVICCDLPCDQVDVNVHPSKREIKFLSPQPVYQAVAQAVEISLVAAQQTVTAYTGSRQMPRSRTSEPMESAWGEQAREYPSVQAPLPWGERWTARAGHLPGQGSSDPSDLSGASDSSPQSSAAPPHPSVSAASDSPAEEPGGAPSHPSRPSSLSPPSGLSPPSALSRPADSADSSHQAESVLSSAATQTPGDASIQKSPAVLGQVMGTYIIAEQEGCLVLVDQHAAHERVVYEALQHRHARLPKDSQFLLVPETLEFSAGEADLLSSILAELETLGLVIEPFGGTTFVIKAVPGLLAQKPVKPLVQGIVETLMETGDTAVTEQWLENCLISMACHHAVQANRSMSPKEMETLIKDLFACENPFHCPHGRPTLVTFDKKRMEKLFKRVV
ncbi:MAG TPA: DNA mismatch repair endonuclease MutL [Desulfotignum sp.]|nr:DNA mismatch repair endonuclease MutL [Desulfotignum sp.]